MTAKIGDDQKRADLEAIVAMYNAGGYQVCLFKATHTPAHDDDATDYTAIEADFPGYARVNLTGGVVAGAVDGSFNATAEFDTSVFTCNASGTPNDIYGYFVLDGAGNYAWAEDRGLAGPTTINTDEQTYVVVPGRKLNNASPP